MIYNLDFYSKCGFDMSSGYALYWNNKIIANLYLRGTDYPRIIYYAICEEITSREFEKLIDGNILENENCFLVNHLAGTKIPNSRNKIYLGVLIRGFHFLRLNVGNREEYETNDVIAPLKKAASFSSQFRDLIDCIRLHPTSPTKIFNHMNFRWEEKVKKTLDKQVKEYLATQKKAVIDLQYGKDEWQESDGLRSRNGIDNHDEYSTPNYCPVKREYIEHLDEITLAIPGQSDSAYFHQLLACIPKEKVTELVVFEPDSLECIIPYVNIQRISLIEVKQNIRLDKLFDLRHLSKVFISCNENVFSREEFQKIHKNFDLGVAIINDYSIETVCVF